MEPIKLTKEHKAKLLEMCEVLFPNSYSKTWNIDVLIDYEPIDDNNFECFHWFEFCMTHLAVRFKKFGIEINYWLMTLPSTHSQWPEQHNHPVDYLYSEFKKIK